MYDDSYNTVQRAMARNPIYGVSVGETIKGTDGTELQKEPGRRGWWYRPRG